MEGDIDRSACKQKWEKLDQDEPYHVEMRLRSVETKRTAWHIQVQFIVLWLCPAQEVEEEYCQLSEQTRL